MKDIWAAFGVEAGVEDGFEHSSRCWCRWVILLAEIEDIGLDLKTFVKASDQAASHIFAIVVVVVVWDNSEQGR